MPDAARKWCHWFEDEMEEDYLDAGHAQAYSHLLRLLAENEKLEAYADKLADGLPEGMLPKDIEVISKANAELLEQNEKLEQEWHLECSLRWEAQSDYGNLMGKTEQLQADRDALVALIRVRNKGDWQNEKKAWQALSEELKELIDE